MEVCNSTNIINVFVNNIHGFCKTDILCIMCNKVYYSYFKQLLSWRPCTKFSNLTTGQHGLKLRLILSLRGGATC